jgi:hypothetical protein
MRIIRSMLGGGDRRSIGRANEVVELIQRNPIRIAELVKCLWDSDSLVAMRASDALEKISRVRAALLRRFKEDLLGLAAETTQQEVRWHLAVIIPRLRLTRLECDRFEEILHNYLGDRSSIVKTFAMQGLCDLIPQNPPMRERVTDLIRSLMRTGTAAMRARGRHLLQELERR